jgi:CheY-like chemotaxis protein
MATRDRFLGPLRFALKHLYDSAALKKSPLLEALGLADSLDPASELRGTLTRSIRSLQPAADMPADTEAWRVYEILLYRHVQRCSQLEVAEQLGMSVRHLRREERKALEVLADQLARRLDGGARGDEEAPGGGGAAQAREQPSAIDAELAWLDQSPPDEPVDLHRVLPAVLELVQPLATQHGASLAVSAPQDEILLAVHPVALRQIMLSLLSVAIRQASGKGVTVSVRPLDWEVEVQVHGQKCALGSQPLPESTEGIASSLHMARHLVEACGGTLTVRSDSGSFVANATLPAVEQLPVLLIDDNADTLQLLQRYASGTRYRIFPARNLVQALALAGEVSPRIIVLDVMMPDLDGWELLGRLRQHPLTGHAPVVVCTILAEEDLALSLGASGFVRKPVSREAFLGALDRQAYPAVSGSQG